MGGMPAEERFEPTAEQRAWLDTLPPETRHAASDWLHRRWCHGMAAARAADDVVDLLLPGVANERAAGLLTFMALFAEAFRARARGNNATANDLAVAATRHWAGGPINIRIADDPERR